MLNYHNHGMSKVEVESKARVVEPSALEKRLAAALGKPEEFGVEDIYFCPEQEQGYPSKRFRLRKTKDIATVTAKEKLPAEGVEASVEHEFSVSDPEAFAHFALSFGFKVFVRKKKQGKRWRLSGTGSDDKFLPAVVELSEVSGLGWFLEVEVMAESEDQVPAARKRVREIFKELGIPEEAIEPRPYTLLLYEKSAGKDENEVDLH